MSDYDDDLKKIFPSLNKALVETLGLQPHPFNDEPQPGQRAGIVKATGTWSRAVGDISLVSWQTAFWIIESYATYGEFLEKIPILLVDCTQSIKAIRTIYLDSIPPYLRGDVQIEENITIPLSTRLQGAKQKSPLMTDVEIPVTITIPLKKVF